MKRARFSEEQILRVLKKAETAGSIRELCREQNITMQTFNRWQRTHGGVEPTTETNTRLSRTERTREATVVNQLGLQLVAYPESDLDQLELPEELRHAIRVCQSIETRAKGRQKRLVCQILRGEDHEAIRARVESLEQSRVKAIRSRRGNRK